MKGLLYLLSFISIATSAVVSFAADNNTASTTLPSESRSFFEAFPPVQFANGFGNRDQGAHGTYGRFPGGFVTPEHTHSHAYRAIVLEGAMTNPFKGEDSPKVMSSGSYWSVAAGEAHTTACVSKEPCTFFMWSDDSFDFIPTENTTR